MKKLLLIAGIVINCSAVRGSFDQVFNDYLKTSRHHCGQLLRYSDEELKSIRLKAWDNASNTSDSKQKKDSINFINFISQCRFPKNTIYNPEYFIEKD